MSGFKNQGEVRLLTCLDHCNLREEVVVLSDARRLKQVILNLVSNAIKFTEKGYVKISCELPDDSVCLHVEDTGVGMSAENIPIIFDTFTQLDSGIGRKFQGSGLGLSISKNIIDRLGGEIRVTSELGKGSCFTIELPMHPKPQKSPPGRMPEVRPEASKAQPNSSETMVSNLKDILVVEDNVSNATLLEISLSFGWFQMHLVSL